MDRYVQIFTDQDTGRLDRVTFEPIEVWTEAGLEIIPAGFRFTIPETARKLTRADEIPLCILYQWRQTGRNRPYRAAVGMFRRELIKYTRKRHKPTRGRFLAFLKDRARIELLILVIRIYSVVRFRN